MKLDKNNPKMMLIIRINHKCSIAYVHSKMLDIFMAVAEREHLLKLRINYADDEWFH